MDSTLTNLTRQLGDLLTRSLEDYLNRWKTNTTEAERALTQRLAEENFQNVLCYLMVMIGLLAFIIVAMLISTVKSRHHEHSGDPYHKYIEEDWRSGVKSQTHSYLQDNLAAQTYSS